MISGGTAAITRGMMLSRAIGYREIHLFGADSSFAGNDTHIRKSTTKEKCIVVNVGGRSFLCAPWMAQQAEDFKILAPSLIGPYKTKMVVHGDGLIPHLARVMGCEVQNGEPKYKHALRHAKYKASQIWQHL